MDFFPIFAGVQWQAELAKRENFTVNGLFKKIDERKLIYRGQRGFSAPPNSNPSGCDVYTLAPSPLMSQNPSVEKSVMRRRRRVKPSPRRKHFASRP